MQDRGRVKSPPSIRLCHPGNCGDGVPGAGLGALNCAHLKIPATRWRILLGLWREHPRGVVCGRESGQNIKLFFYVSPFGSILITVWTPNFQNSDLTEN